MTKTNIALGIADSIRSQLYDLGPMEAFDAAAIIISDLEARGYVIERGWQPIEIAPEEIKDGRRVLGYGTIRGEHGYSDDHKAEFFMRWSTEIRRLKDGSVKRDSRWVIDQPTPRYFCGISVTHFALLPEPPK